MGLMTKIKNKREKHAEKKFNEDVELAQHNPYSQTSMRLKDKKNPFESFGNYASEKIQRQGNYQTVEVSNSLQNNQPQYEETWEEHKKKMNEQKAKEAEEKRQWEIQQNYEGEEIINNGNVDTYDPDDLNAPVVVTKDVDDLNNSVVNYKFNDQNNKNNFYGAEDAQQQQQITEEEEELEDIKGETSFIRGKTVDTTRNIIELADQAQASGMNTMGMLGSQSRKLYDAESYVVLGKTQTELAKERAKELRTAGNVFQAPSNPFNRKNRMKAKEQKQIASMIEERERNDENLRRYQQSESRAKETLGYYPGMYNGDTAQERRTKESILKQNQQYLIDEEDDEEKEKELEINHNLKIIHGQTKNLRKLAENMNNEVADQEDRINNLTEGVNKVELGVRTTTARLNRITGK